MKIGSIYLYILVLLLLTTFASCKKEECESCINENLKPRANAGHDQTILVQMDAILDGKLSYDRNVRIASYGWSLLSGPSGVTIDSALNIETFARFKETGIYQFELRVTNANGIAATDTLQVRVENISPEMVCNRPVISAKLVPIGKLPGPRAHMKTLVAGNKIFFAGGSTPSYSGSVDIYDISTNTWTGFTLSDEALRADLAITSLGNKVFFAGGGHSWSDYYTSVVDIYDVGTNSWSKANLSKARLGIAAAAAGNTVIFAGGGYYDEMSPGGFQTVKEVDIYNNVTNSWTTTTLSEGRTYMNGIAAGDEFYFSGGTNSNYGASGKMDTYNVKTQTWTSSMLNIPGTRMDGIVDQNKLFLSGGFQPGGNIGSKYVEIIDLATGNSELECMILKNGQTPIKSGDNLIFFTGNALANDLRNGSVFEIYNTKTKAWSVGVLNRAIHSAGIVALNHTIYVGGGIDATGKTVDMFWKLEL